MYELIQVAERTWYIDCPAKIGVYLMNDTEVCLIDSGSDKDAARRILKILTAKGWTLRKILATHSHADHVGGCAALHARTGCEVYAPDTDLSLSLPCFTAAARPSLCAANSSWPSQVLPSL